MNSEVPQPRQIRMETKEPLRDSLFSHFFLPLRESSRLRPDSWMVDRVFSLLRPPATPSSGRWNRNRTQHQAAPEIDRSP